MIFETIFGIFLFVGTFLLILANIANKRDYGKHCKYIVQNITISASEIRGPNDIIACNRRCVNIDASGAFNERY